MRRLFLTPALALVLAAVVIACGGDESADGTGATPVSTPAETQTPAETPAAPATAEVAALFADNCAGCHGADGGGGTGPDLRGEDDLAGVKAQIESGGGAMPAFSSQLPPGQIDALGQYVVDGLQ